MSFSGLEFQLSYSSPEDNVIEDFLLPALKEAVNYDRASAYFSSLSLLDLITGIRSLVEKKGKIRLIISPQIDASDSEAIKQGYELRQNGRKKVEGFLLTTFKDAKNDEQRERYNILSHLIASGTLDIKVAVMKQNPKTGIFHDKMGILEDSHNNLIAFSGSMNETRNGMKINHENIDVYSSSGPDYRRAIAKKDHFDKYWNNQVDTIDVFDFPEDLKAKINAYHKERIDWDKAGENLVTESESKARLNIPHIPDSVILRPYQLDAINKWQEAGFRGFYDMATGTGKTITALSSIVRILNEKKSRLAIIIVVPYIHLVSQWMKDLDRFGIQAIGGYSQSKTKNWRKKFESRISLFNLGLKKYLCLITTNASFRLKATRQLIDRIEGNILLVVDEAHNFRGTTLLKQLDDRFVYRLALSATLGDERDPSVKKLYEYFSPVCIHYSLDQAIRDRMLTPYKYYPVVVELTPEERDSYNDLSYRISRLVDRKANGEPKLDSTGKVKFLPEAKPLLIKRSRLIAGAKNKLEMLKTVLFDMPKKDHLLIYCGATNVNLDEEEFIPPSEEEMRQIEAVRLIIQKDFDLKGASYTSKESLTEREQLVERFDEGDLDALVAIRCLDEGVDIPSIRQAILMASTTNPKEYIQRRGRILRNYDGKASALLIDMVVVPDKLDETWFNNVGEYDLSLVRREAARVREFGRSALNSMDSYNLLQVLEQKYGDLSYKNRNEPGEEEWYE